MTEGSSMLLKWWWERERRTTEVQVLSVEGRCGTAQLERRRGGGGRDMSIFPVRSVISFWESCLSFSFFHFTLLFWEGGDVPCRWMMLCEDHGGDDSFSGEWI